MAKTVADGIYEVNCGIFKVVTSPNSGRSYAKMLNEADGSWAYAPGAVNNLRPETKMPLEHAMQYGKLYGRCISCGRTLTDEESIEAGIGPVCAGRW